MPFKIEECTDADYYRAFELLSTAFGHEHAFVESVFPNHDSPEGRRAGGERLLEAAKTEPTITDIKAVDEETGKTIGHARWMICDGRIPPESELSGDYWETQDQKDFAAHMFSQYLVPRRKAIKESGGHIVSLDLMIIDPDYQRKGAGRGLMDWGLAISDRLGVETVVEATDPARPLYESGGFEVKYKYEVPLPEKWADRDTQRYWWMIRPKQAPKKEHST